MKSQKINKINIASRLTNDEMKNIMAGSDRCRSIRTLFTDNVKCCQIIVPQTVCLSPVRLVALDNWLGSEPIMVVGMCCRNRKVELY